MAACFYDDDVVVAAHENESMSRAYSLPLPKEGEERGGGEKIVHDRC
jgi:hypothetical protein